MLKQIIPASVWKYRYFIYTSVKSDFKSRVARSRLGLLWLVIAPLSQVLMYAFVLSSLMSQRLPGIDNKFSYSIYLLSGFLGWFLFVDIFNRCLTMFIDNANVLKKIAFPRMALPLVVVISALINNVIFFVIILSAFVLLGFGVDYHVLYLPLIVVINVMFAAGIGLVCGILNVFIRDVGQICQIVIQFAFWMTPVVYTKTILPPVAQSILKLNPMYWIVESYHEVLVYGADPDFAALGVLSVLSFGLLLFSMFLFRKSSPEMVDVL